MHLDGHDVSGGNGAVAGGRAGVGVAADVVAAHVRDGAVARHDTSTLGSVQNS